MDRVALCAESRLKAGYNAMSIFRWIFQSTDKNFE